MKSIGSILDGGRLRYVVEVRFDDLNVATFTSHDDISWPTGTVYASTLTGRIASVSQGIAPEEYRTTIGSFTFEVIDKSGQVTTDFGARLTSGFSFAKTEVRFYIGRRGGLGVGMEPEPVVTQVVRKVRYDRQNGTYRIECADRWSKAKGRAFKVRTSSLATARTAVYTAATFTTEPSASFDRVKHGSEATESPGIESTIVRIGDEIMRIRDSGNIVQADRGRFDTPPDEHEAGESVEEIAYFEEKVLDAICLVLTGKRRTGSDDIWPSLWHLGLDRDTELDVDRFDLGADIERITCRFFIDKAEDGKTFIETQLLPLIGAVVFIEGDGRIGLKRLSPSVDGSNAAIVLNQTNLRSVSEQNYDVGAVRNLIEVAWDHDLEGEPRRSNIVFDTDSAARNGETEVEELNLRGLHGSRHTQQIIDTIAGRQLERLADPPFRGTVSGMRDACLVEAGDTVRLNLAGMPDMKGSPITQIDRGFEVRRASVDWRALRTRLSLFSSTSELGSNPLAVAPVMEDSYYTAAGSAVPNVSGGVLSATATLTEGTWYVDGDLTIDGTLNVQGHVELRVKGFLTINGSIDGRGANGAGKTETASPTTTGTPFAYRRPDPGDRGFVGLTQSNAGRVFGGPFSLLASPVAEGTHQQAPLLSMRNIDGTAILGVPEDTRGTSGGAGGFHFWDPGVTGTYTVFAGGNGGEEGAGLVIVCRGIAVTGSIDLSGGDGFQSIAAEGAGGGAGGSGGALYVLLDGNVTESGVRSNFSSVRGATAVWPLISAATSLQTFLGTPTVEQRDIHHRIQYIPPRESLAPSPASRVEFIAIARPDVHFLEEDNQGDLAGALNAFNAANYTPQALAIPGRADITSQASWSLAGTTGNGTLALTVNPTTGLLQLSDATGFMVARIQATIGGYTAEVTISFFRVAAGFAGTGQASIDDLSLAKGRLEGESQGAAFFDATSA